jgi:hypothetical protein
MKRSDFIKLSAAGLIGLQTMSCSPHKTAEVIKTVKDKNPKFDDIIYLMGGAAKRSPNMKTNDLGKMKYSWVNGFSNVNDFFEWDINLPSSDIYYVTALLNSGSPTTLSLSLSGSSTKLNLITHDYGWDRLKAGKIKLPAGVNTLKLQRNTSKSNDIQFRSIELLPESKQQDYLDRVQSFRANTDWLSKTNYGLMFQYGPWGYPKHRDKKSLNEQAEDFDVKQFVNMVKSTGASYVIWSITWWTYQMDAPISSVDKIVGNGNLTSQRDLIGEVANALQDQGIRFMLYYNEKGANPHSDFWQAQDWPSSFGQTGVGDRSTFFSNWLKIIKQIGNRYGHNLDGWFFDDGMGYYPAPFEKLGKIARSGNKDRLISYNPWILPRGTDFQDVYFGEASHGKVRAGSGLPGENGVFTKGPQKGLLQHGMFRMEQAWGVHKKSQPINTRKVVAKNAVRWVKNAIIRRVPISFNMMMWENGRVSPDTLRVLHDVKKAVYG